MRRFSALSALFASFFSKELYRDVAHAWRGIGFLYLVLVSMITWAPTVAVTHFQVKKYVEELWPIAVQHFPEFKNEKGIISSTAPQPYIVMDNSKPPKPEFVLDTTGAIKSFEDTTAPLLVTRTRIYMRNPARSDERSIDAKSFPDLTINPAKLTEWGRLFSKWYGVLAFVIMTIGSVMWGALAIVALSLLGAVIAGGQSTVSTTGYLRLAAVARTPALLLTAVIQFFAISVPMWFGISFLVSIGYMIRAVNAANAIPAKPFDGMAPPPPAPFTHTAPPPAATEPACFTAPPQDPPQQ